MKSMGKFTLRYESNKFWRPDPESRVAAFCRTYRPTPAEAERLAGRAHFAQATNHVNAFICDM